MEDESAPKGAAGLQIRGPQRQVFAAGVGIGRRAGVHSRIHSRKCPKGTNPLALTDLAKEHDFSRANQTRKAVQKTTLSLRGGIYSDAGV